MQYTEVFFSYIFFKERAKMKYALNMDARKQEERNLNFRKNFMN